MEKVANQHFQQKEQNVSKVRKVKDVSFFILFKYQFKSVLRHKSFFIVAILSMF
ncbi:hypothetical protein SCLARK_001393 [Spiroplasma clarkii]|uniref:hypothetical protein n=1 Tax=Spiroplasma clarkii TaxID=2139 RepID=UPI000B560E83|nr:hypothetical protein [Spiroplasma clarkii]ARU91918.1 hypothetical protein SCLARK_001393 [Spiroplasma clarkii]